MKPNADRIFLNDRFSSSYIQPLHHDLSHGHLYYSNNCFIPYKAGNVSYPFYHTYPRYTTNNHLTFTPSTSHRRSNSLSDVIMNQSFQNKENLNSFTQSNISGIMKNNFNILGIENENLAFYSQELHALHQLRERYQKQVLAIHSEKPSSKHQSLGSLLSFQAGQKKKISNAKQEMENYMHILKLKIEGKRKYLSTRCNQNERNMADKKAGKTEEVLDRLITLTDTLRKKLVSDEDIGLEAFPEETLGQRIEDNILQQGKLDPSSHESPKKLATTIIPNRPAKMNTAGKRRDMSIEDIDPITKANKVAGDSSSIKDDMIKVDASLKEELKSLLAETEDGIKNNQENNGGEKQVNNENSTKNENASERAASLQQKKEKYKKNRTSKLNTSLLMYSAAHSDWLPKPLWRWKASGTDDPLPELVLKGKSLFRAIVFCLLFSQQMTLGVRRIKKEEKQIESQKLAIRVPEVVEYFGEWFQRVIRPTLQSLFTETNTKIFLSEPNAHVGGGVSKLLKTSIRYLSGYSDEKLSRQKMMKLKVRTKTIIDAITKEDVSNTMIDHLVEIFHDGLYYPSDFLYKHEIDTLEFTDIGAVRRLKPILHEGESDIERALVLPDMSNITFESSRLYILLSNFLICKVLIQEVLLRPLIEENRMYKLSLIRKTKRRKSSNAALIKSGNEEKAEEVNEDVSSVSDKSVYRRRISETVSLNLRTIATILYLIFKTKQKSLLDLEEHFVGLYPSHLRSSYSNDDKSESNEETGQTISLDKEEEIKTGTDIEEVQSPYLSNEKLVLELLPNSSIKPYIELMQPWMEKFSDDLDIWLSKIVEKTVRRLDLSGY